ncbi:T6SS immunity protein Tli4 family protein [Massilia sp. METH4]|uniref:T6SS immunity protein Tli4 family protein n=1 Tax=Massilia sp. METH4 TaxID=3123041 RepID=UPI0030CD8991
MNYLLIVFAMAGLLSACRENEDKGVAMKSEAYNTVPYCAGRVSFLLPEGWRQRRSVQATFGLEGVGDDGDDIEVVTEEGLSQKNFEEKILVRTAEIRKSQDIDTDVLELKHIVGPQEILFRIKRIGSSYSSELHKLIDGTYVRMSTDSFNGQFVAAEHRLYDFAKALRSNTGHSAEGGFCIGVISVLQKYSSEAIRVGYESSEHSDALLSLDIDTFRPDEGVSLFQRVTGTDSLLNRFGVTSRVIRKRETKVAGMTAQEWMAWMPADKSSDSGRFLFAVESRRTKPDRLRPSIHAELETARRSTDGARQQNSLSESEAVILWDNFVESFATR